MQIILFKIDTYLPLKVWKICPFIYTGPNFAPFQVGLLPGVVQYQGSVAQRFYPLTVYWEESKTRMTNHLFAFCFLCQSDTQQLSFYVAPICWLCDNKKEIVLDFFLTQIEELACELKASSITMEVNSDINARIAFPTSLSPFSYDLENHVALDIDEGQLQTYGFHPLRYIHCYERNLITKKTLPTPPRNYQFQEISGSQNQALTPAISQLPYHAFTLASVNSGLSMHSEHLDEIRILAFKKQGWFKKPELEGYLQWTPNLFEPSRTYHLPVPLIFQYAYHDYPYTLGKIVDWGFNTINSRLIATLLDHVAVSMQKRGILKLQIGGVLEGSELQSVLASENFTPIHTINLLQKQVN